MKAHDLAVLEFKDQLLAIEPEFRLRSAANRFRTDRVPAHFVRPFHFLNLTREKQLRPRHELQSPFRETQIDRHLADLRIHILGDPSAVKLFRRTLSGFERGEDVAATQNVAAKKTAHNERNAQRQCGKSLIINPFILTGLYAAHQDFSVDAD